MASQPHPVRDEQPLVVPSRAVALASSSAYGATDQATPEADL